MGRPKVPDAYQGRVSYANVALKSCVVSNLNIMLQVAVLRT
jgi:hypothetical protein